MYITWFFHRMKYFLAHYYLFKTFILFPCITIGNKGDNCVPGPSEDERRHGCTATLPASYCLVADGEAQETKKFHE